MFGVRLEIGCVRGLVGWLLQIYAFVIVCVCRDRGVSTRLTFVRPRVSTPAAEQLVIVPPKVRGIAAACAQTTDELSTFYF